jgi:hypothetical protein
MKSSISQKPIYGADQTSAFGASTWRIECVRRATAQARRAKLGGIGHGVPSDFELNFGSHLPRLRRSGSDDGNTQR